jgi:hypothetical protein
LQERSSLRITQEKLGADLSQYKNRPKNTADAESDWQMCRIKASGEFAIFGFAVTALVEADVNRIGIGTIYFKSRKIVIPEKITSCGSAFLPEGHKSFKLENPCASTRNFHLISPKRAFRNS